MTTRPAAAPCPSCLAEAPGRMLGLDLVGLHHVCQMDVWRAATPTGRTVQVTGATGPDRCPICHGIGHDGRAAYSGPPSCPGADQLGPPGWLPADLAAERAARRLAELARRAEIGRAILTGFLGALIVLIFCAGLLFLALWPGLG